MALIDVRCENDHVSEVYRPAADWPATPPCPDCGAVTAQIHLPRAQQWTVDPTIVYRGPDGLIRFPGDSGGRMAAQYQRDGYERIELRSAADVRRFEKHMNAVEYSRASRRVERKQMMRERREAESRSELRRLMPGMTEFGRQLARAAMGRNDAKPRERAKEAGFHLEAYSYDRSNREASRDAQGRRRRD